MFESPMEKRNKFNKKLYNTAIIQGIFDRIAELQDRVDKLERRDLK